MILFAAILALAVALTQRTGLPQLRYRQPAMVHTLAEAHLDDTSWADGMRRVYRHRWALEDLTSPYQQARDLHHTLRQPADTRPGNPAAVWRTPAPVSVLHHPGWREVAHAA